MIISDERKHLYRQLFSKNKDLQFIVAIEELSELIQALTKYLRGKNNFQNIVEELADVEIVLEELNDFFDCDLLVENKKAEKLKRTRIRCLDEDFSEL